MSELSRAAAALLAETRNADPVSLHVKQRLAARVNQSIVAGTVSAITAEVEAALLTGTAPVAMTTSQLVLGKFSLVGAFIGYKVPAVVGVLLVSAVVTTTFLKTAPPTPHATVTATAQQKTDVDTESAAVLSSTNPTQLNVPAAAPSKRIPPSQKPSLGFKDELAKLGEARRILSQGRPEEALVILRDYERLFPKGALREEATATRIIAHCGLGDSEGARSARRFAAQSPGSPLALRVSRACGLSTDVDSKNR